MKLGWIYRALGNYDLALSSSLRSLRIQPNQPQTLENLGKIYFEIGEFNNAKKPLKMQ